MFYCLIQPVSFVLACNAVVAWTIVDLYMRYAY